ncbi:hypothetical protein ACFE04_020230 [Oxalis oulophora]
MSVATTACVRSLLRSTASSRAAATSRLRVAPKSVPTSATRSPFRISNQNSLSQRIVRTPVELSCCMLPYHTATASALLTSMLSASSTSAAWSLEGFGQGIFVHPLQGKVGIEAYSGVLEAPCPFIHPKMTIKEINLGQYLSE